LWLEGKTVYWNNTNAIHISCVPINVVFSCYGACGEVAKWGMS
jgi:hypothetical protein